MTFDEPIQLLETADEVISIRNASGQTIPIQGISQSGSGREIWLSVDALIESQYQLVFRGSEIVDRVGNALALGEVTRNLAAAITIESMPIVPDLIAYWPFDTANLSADSVNETHGQVEGDPQIVAGHIGDALRFDGIDDGLVFPNSPAWNGVDEFTISLWFQADPTQLSGDGLFALVDKSHGFSRGYVGWAMQGSASGNVLKFGVGDGTDFREAAIERNVLDGVFHHVVATVDRDTIKIYFDGELQNSLPLPIDPIVDSGDIYLGRVLGDDGISRRFHGTMDDVAIWSRALDEREVDALFSDGVGVDLRALMP